MTNSEEEIQIRVARSRIYQESKLKHKLSEIIQQRDSLDNKGKLREKRGAKLASQSFKSISNGDLYKVLGEITSREKEIAIGFIRYVLYGRIEKSMIIKKELNKQI